MDIPTGITVVVGHLTIGVFDLNETTSIIGVVSACALRIREAAIESEHGREGNYWRHSIIYLKEEVNTIKGFSNMANSNL
mgnify:CR=1 FL=1